MNSYNLLDEPWLPVRWANDDPPTAVSLRDILRRAADITELATDNPLETIALNRLLAALLAAIYPGAVEEAEWVRLWKQGHFDEAVCERYFTTYADRFDLLSPTRPFFGHPQTDAKEISPLTRLLHAATSGNNAVLFSHDLDSQPPKLTAAEAARAVICTQAAALGGGVAQPFNFCHAPLVGGAYFWLRGAVDERPNLFRALLLNLTPSPKVWGDIQDDAPTWESEKPPVATKRPVSGIRQLFTLQSRRLQLVSDNEGNMIGVRYNQGSKAELVFHDPYLTYRSGKEGEYALRFQAGRALWQDSALYMQHESGAGGHAPRTLEWLSRARRRQLGLSRATAYAADVFGLVNDQAKVEMWRQERVTIYPEIIADESRWQTLHNLLLAASREHQAGRLREATKAFAIRARLHKPWGTRLGDVERGDVEDFVQTLNTEARYWPALGKQFDGFLGRIATQPEEALEQVLIDWQKVIRRAAREALHHALAPLALDARTLQALAEAETVLTYGTLHPKPAKNPQPESI
jgi:CRISPR system Cascade subunit CasA